MINRSIKRVCAYSLASLSTLKTTCGLGGSNFMEEKKKGVLFLIQENEKGGLTLQS